MAAYGSTSTNSKYSRLDDVEDPAAGANENDRALAMLCDGTLLLGLKKKKRVLQLP
jgi:hypothetical protein